jgi:membrane fusion protein, multidrug efflux system
MKYLILAICISMIYSCGTKNLNEQGNAEKRQYTAQQNPVEVLRLQKGTFKKELVNNGKLVALRKSELQFRVGEQLEKLNVKNGDKVRGGQIIATLNSFTYQQQLASAQIQVQKTQLELQNVLISRGYNTMDSTQISPQIFQLSRVKSGYADALQSFKTAAFNLESTKLVAPFSGIVANLKPKQYDHVDSGSSFCTLIDDSEFEAEFQIVESEVGDIRMGDEVQIIPFSNQTISKGRISEINPVVDENGLILIKALVKNSGSLMDGMNVKVLVEKEIPDQLVVPKSAVVLRDNQEVLFKCTKDSIAFWVYVKTGFENSSSYSVQADPDKGGSLQSGDTIIVSGNLNLAHESIVTVK